MYVLLFIVILFEFGNSSTIFKNLVKMRELSLDVVDEFNCGCLHAIQSQGVDRETDIYLDRFGHYSARGMKYGISRRLVQTGVYSYETYLNLHKRNALKKSCFKSLHIILGVNSSKQLLEEVSRRNILSDSMWLVFLNTSIHNFFENVNMRFDSNIFVATDSSHSQSFDITEVYRVRRRASIVTNKIAVWSETTGFNAPIVPHYLRRANLEGLILKTVGLIFEEGNSPDQPLGDIYTTTWAEMEKILNFSSISVRPENNLIGFPGKDGQWSGHLGMIQRGEVDAILTPLDFSSWRLRIVRYLLPILSSRFQVFFQRNDSVPDWWFLLRPFSSTVWLASLAWIIVMSSAVYVCNKISFEYGLHDHQSSIVNTILFVFQTMCAQGSNVAPKIGCVRFMIVLCYLASTVMIAAYSGALISSLTKRTPIKPYDDFAGLLKSGHSLIIPGSNNSAFEYFTSADDGLRKTVFTKLVAPNHKILVDSENMTSLFIYICENDRVATFANEDSFNSYLQKFHIKGCHMSKFSQPLSIIYQSIGLHKNSSYTDLMNYTILRLVERGILGRIRKSYLRNSDLAADVSMIHLSIYDVFEIFVFMLCATALSTVILLGEIYCAKKPRKLYDYY